MERDSRGRFVKGHKPLGAAIQSREKAVANGAKGGIASGEAKRERKHWNEILEEILSNPISVSMPDGSKKNVKMDEALLMSMVKAAIGGDIKASMFIGRILGESEDKRSQDQPGTSELPQHSVDVDRHMEAIRTYLVEEKKMTNVDELTMELLRADLETLVLINKELAQRMTILDQYKRPIPSPFLREKDKIIKRIMEYEKKLGLSPYDRKKLNGTDADSGNPFDAFLDGETSEMTPDEL